jgi:quercetin dioxygenase-like cupin family protein
MKNPRLALGATLALVVLATGTYLSSASATPASTGDLAPRQADVASGVLVGSEDGPRTVSQDGVGLTTTAETTVTTFELTYPVGSSSGWHSHPGIVVAVVKEGSVARRTGCTEVVFSEGESFTETGPHHVSNAGEVDAVLSITRVYPTGSTVGRIDEPAPRCS